MKKSEISPDMLDKIGIEKNSMKLHEVHLLFIVISCGLFYWPPHSPMPLVAPCKKDAISLFQAHLLL